MSGYIDDTTLFDLPPSTFSYDVTSDIGDETTPNEYLTTSTYDDTMSDTIVTGAPYSSAQPFLCNITDFGNETSNTSAQPFLCNSTDYGVESSTEYYYDYDELIFEIYEFEVYLLGYVWPCLVFFILCTNTIVVAYFVAAKNRGRATNYLFIGIAVSDTLTCVSLLPNSIYIYAMKNDLITEEWCKAYMMLRLYVSPVFHTISVWQTVILSVQRYTCVCHPFISSRICTPTKTIVAIGCTTVFSMLLHTYHLVDDKVNYSQCGWVIERGCTKSCVYLWFSIVLQHLLPCILLSVLTTKTIVELNTATKRVSITLPRVDTKRSSRDKVITIASALIVIVFLCPELPHGIYKLSIVIRYSEEPNLRTEAVAYHIVICIYELMLVLTFLANFWIYFGMMKDFRKFFFQVVKCGILRYGLSRTKSLSSASHASRNGSVRTNVSRNNSFVGRNRVMSTTTTLPSTSSDTAHALIQLSPPINLETPRFPVMENGRLMDPRNDENNDDVFL